MDNRSLQEHILHDFGEVFASPKFREAAASYRAAVETNRTELTSAIREVPALLSAARETMKHGRAAAEMITVGIRNADEGRGPAI